MRGVYYEYFYIPKDGKGKIREKVFLTRMAVTCLFMVLCLVLLAVMAYAHFSSDVMTDDTVIQTSKYDLDWRITTNKEQTVNGKIVCTEEEQFPKEYDITVSLGAENTASTGFCIIDVYEYSSTLTAEQDAFPVLTYHTVQIGNDKLAENGKRESISFKLSLTFPCVVTFTPNWGTSGNYNYDNGNSDEYIEDAETVSVEMKITQAEGEGEKYDSPNTSAVDTSDVIPTPSDSDKKEPVGAYDDPPATTDVTETVSVPNTEPTPIPESTAPAQTEAVTTPDIQTADTQSPDTTTVPVMPTDTSSPDTTSQNTDPASTEEADPTETTPPNATQSPPEDTVTEPPTVGTQAPVADTLSPDSSADTIVT